MDRIELNNGIQMLLLGFGVFQITDPQICKESVKTALETGYRMIDTAACMGFALSSNIGKEIFYAKDNSFHCGTSYGSSAECLWNIC